MAQTPSFVPTFNLEVDNHINLTSEEKEIFDGLNLSSIGNYDPYPSVPIYTFTEAHIEENEGLELSAGSYALWGNTIDGYQLEPLDIRDANNIKSIGSKQAFSSLSKAIFDELGIDLIGNYDPFFSPVYTISEADLSDYESLELLHTCY